MYNKNLIPSLQFIDKLTQEKVTISGLPFTEKEARLSINERRPSFLLPTKEMIKMIVMHMKGTTQFKSLEVSMSNENYEISRANLSSSSEKNGEDDDHTCQIKFSRFMDSRWDEEAKYFYRLFLPIKDHNWRDLVHSTAYYQHSVYRSTPTESLIRIDFGGGGQVHVFSIRSGQDNFLVIESQSSCTYSAIKKYMYPISLSLGLVTSVAPFDYAFVVTSETPEFDGKIMGGIVKLRSTIYNPYSFFITYSLDLYEGLKGIADYTLHQLCENGRLKDPLDRPIEEQEFAALARMLYENKALARAALMLIDSSMNLECLGAIYAVALETICTGLIEANKDFFSKYIEQKPWDDEWISNKNKLIRPFDLPEIGYELSEEKGKELLGIRNSFLHGGVLGFSHTEYYKLLYPCMKLRSFCGILLFRHAGFKGPILNNAVALGLEEAIENEEPLFITYDEEAAKELVEKRKKEKQKEKDEKKKQSQGKEKSPQPTEEPEASV